MKLRTLIKAAVLVLACLPSAGFSKQKKEVLNDWFALGSGCKARSDVGGDVAVERFREEKNQNEIYGAKFKLDKFEISSESPSAKNPLKYAKECAIRININPPKGKRIRRVMAVTQLDVTKDHNTDILLNGELKIGSLSLGYQRYMYKKDKQLAGLAETILIDSDLSQLTGFEPMPQLRCGEAKIIGFDLTFILNRNASGAALAKLMQDKGLEIKAELEDCKV